MTSALAPAFSPVERERIVHRILSSVTGWVVVRLIADDTESVTATKIEKFTLSSHVMMRSLSRRRGPG
jgi:hypothetical protein